MRWIMVICALFLVAAIADAHLFGRLRARRTVETTVATPAATKVVQLPVKPSTDKAPNAKPAEKIGPPKPEPVKQASGCQGGNCSAPVRGFFFRRR